MILGSLDFLPLTFYNFIYHYLINIYSFFFDFNSENKYFSKNNDYIIGYS